MINDELPNKKSAAQKFLNLSPLNSQRFFAVVEFNFLNNIRTEKQKKKNNKTKTSFFLHQTFENESKEKK